MDSLFRFQDLMLAQVNKEHFRFLYHRLPRQERMFAIKGPRGAGKTTLLLQWLKYELGAPEEALYVTADHPWFYSHSLFDLADQFTAYGGRHLLIDEIHQYSNWSRELKNIYDGYADLQVIITASSALNLYRGAADLSRRLLTFELPGLSFREYLSMVHQIDHPALSLEHLLQNHVKLARERTASFKPLPKFQEYLRTGYLPFTLEGKDTFYFTRLIETVNATLERDLRVIEDYSAANVQKIKRLLGVLAESVPFEPNISALASKLGMGRDTVNTYLYHLGDARLLNLLQSATKGVAVLQKPDKIYLENTNLSFALKEHPDVGTVRETFFLSQLRNAGHDVTLPKQGDFLIDNRFTMEVGGKKKKAGQIRDLENAYVAADDLEIGFGRKIPLWMFGFLY
jgi:predicted AAA+ superfamily ATPase